jgi:hypothetical protein
MIPIAQFYPQYPSSPRREKCRSTSVNETLIRESVIASRTADCTLVWRREMRAKRSEAS